MSQKVRCSFSANHIFREESEIISLLCFGQCCLAVAVKDWWDVKVKKANEGPTKDWEANVCVCVCVNAYVYVCVYSTISKQALLI